MASDPPYRDFYYPLNVFMHVLTHEEGGVDYLHYGLFAHGGESIRQAQEHSTDLLFDRLPAPPASVLEAGIGLGTTLARLTRLGYDATGITPDEKQVAMARARHPETQIECVRFEDLSARRFDVVVFQESSQYIAANALFAKAREITNDVIVIDEFATTSEGSLHQLDAFLRAAADHGFRIRENLDVSQRAAPTVDYFMQRFERYRRAIVEDIGITDEQIDELIDSGNRYRDLYARGIYVYRLLRFAR